MIFNKKTKLLLNLFFLILTCGIIYVKIDFNLLIKIIYNVNLFYISFALIILIFAQIISAFRMRIYFNSVESINISRIYSIKLFFASMYYNIVLPGGIGGDVYKIYIMEKLYDLPKLISLKLAFANRLNGLIIIIIMLGIEFNLYDKHIHLSNLKLYIIGLIFFCLMIYFLMVKYITKENISTLLKASSYSIIIQLFGLISVIFILLAISSKLTTVQINNYLTIFLISSIASSLPISIGGIGIREMSFITCSKYFNIDLEIGALTATIYYIVNLIVSLFGIFSIKK